MLFLVQNCMMIDNGFCPASNFAQMEDDVLKLGVAAVLCGLGEMSGRDHRAFLLFLPVLVIVTHLALRMCASAIIDCLLIRCKGGRSCYLLRQSRHHRDWQGWTEEWQIFAAVETLRQEVSRSMQVTVAVINVSTLSATQPSTPSCSTATCLRSRQPSDTEQQGLLHQRRTWDQIPSTSHLDPQSPW